MPPPLPRDPRGDPAVLLVGPGPRAASLLRILATFAEDVEVRAFADVADLVLPSGRAGLLLLDVDATPLEDVGFVRRFRVAHADVELVLLGSDVRGRSARALGTRRFTPWPPDVEELAALVAEARAAAPRGEHRAAADSARTATDARGADARGAGPRGAEAAPAAGGDAELDEVRAILAAQEPARMDAAREARASNARAEDGTRTSARDAGLSEPAAPRSFDEAFPGDYEDEDDDDDEGDAFRDPPAAAPVEHAPAAGRPRVAGLDQDEIDEIEALLAGADAADAALSAPRERPRAAPEDPARAAEAPAHEPTNSLAAPPWWRAQVADLADVAQRIDLALRRLAASVPDVDEGEEPEAHERLRELEGDVARLVQFARTLGYVAAPPAAGTQVFDLGEIVHLFAANLASSGADAPRCQFKTSRGADVRSDKELVSQALDAVFFLVRCTSRKGDLVRAQVALSEGDGRGWVELSLDFPSGPLDGVPEAEIVGPYGLTDLFPDLGPNALSAAQGIVAGQGGSLTLVARGRGRLTWRLRLPRADVHG